jgi:hypothetical protein
LVAEKQLGKKGEVEKKIQEVELLAMGLCMRLKKKVALFI